MIHAYIAYDTNYYFYLPVQVIFAFIMVKLFQTS